MTTQDLTIKLKLKDDASKTMGKASKNIKGHAGKIRANLGKIGTVGGASLMVAAGAALKLGDVFKDAENIIAAGTGATGDDLEDLKDSFKDVFVDVPDDAATVASAIADVNTAFGFTGDHLEEIATLALGAGRAMSEDMGGLIAVTADALIAFGKPMTDAESLMDKLTVASQASGTSMKEIADKVVLFGPQLNAMGLPLDESIALITNMESAGLDAGAMMPGLSKAMKKLADEGVTDISGALQDAIEEIGNTEDDTAALALAMDTFGAGAGVKFKDAIDKGVFSLDDMLAVMADSDGALKTLAEETLTSADKFDIMKNKVMGAMAPIGDFATAAGPMLMIIPALTAMTSALSVAKVFSTVVTWLQAAAMVALNVAMGPIGLIIIGITLAIAAVILIFKNWDKIMGLFQKVWDKFKDGIEWLRDKWENIWGKVKAAFKTVVDAIKKLFDSKLGWLLPGGALVKAVLWIRDNWKTIWDKIKTTFKTVVGAIKTAFTATFGWLLPGGALENGLNLLRDNWDKIWNGMKDVVKAIVNPIIGFINAIIGGLNFLIRGLNKIKIETPAWVPVFGGKGFQFNVPEIPDIPTLAEGGIVTKPTLALVGERGPEAVIPLSKGAGRGMTTVININFPPGSTVILDNEESAMLLADQITQQIRSVLRAQGAF